MADTSTATNDYLDTVKKLNEQLISTVKESQSAVLEAARSFADALPAVPSNLPKVPGIVALPDVEAVTSYGFDLAAELLAAQKDFVVSLASTFTPAKSDES
jgi:hypothetical protein